ncbi:DUF2255 family protein [Streptomyces sp.]|uniref:DUF2255 family protein n=1 Tax=Streptomyces sp. TaxID=1931 RepID=UPI0025EDCC98|nr:DUF2255 family protein [Streptomyces sp.]
MGPSAGGVGKDVALSEESDPRVNDRLDAAYRTKYGRYGGTYVTPMVAGPGHHSPAPAEMKKALVARPDLGQRRLGVPTP